MGVHGLWRLIEPSGKPVPLETLENKVLGVDVSIWLHQAIKGFQDSKGAPLPNAHLLGIYHRVCKLLYFKIKPVFVFDGGVPVLKKETIAKRNQLKARHTNEANKIQKQILNTLLRHTAVNKVLSEQTKTQLPVKPNKPQQDPQSDDLFKLPPSQLDSTISSSDEEDYTTTSTSDSSPTKYWDIHTIDEKSAQFRSLPADVRHEILTDLKETRKQSSWGRIHELPTESNEFSGYQMKRLLKRFSIQSSLEETEKEMGGVSLSMGELESLLNDHGVITGDSVGNRIASDENTRYLYIKDVKKAMEKARLENLKPIIEEETESTPLKDNLNRLDSSKDNLEKNASSKDNLETNSDMCSSSEQNACSSTKDTLDNNIFESSSSKATSETNNDLIDDSEYQRDLNLAIQLSLQDGASSSNGNLGVTSSKSKSGKTNCSSTQNIKNLQAFSAAMGYMIEYGGLTPAGVNEILMGRNVPEEESESDEEKSIILKLLEEDFYSSKLAITEQSNKESKFLENDCNSTKQLAITEGNKKSNKTTVIEVDVKTDSKNSVSNSAIKTKENQLEISVPSDSDNTNNTRAEIVKFNSSDTVLKNSDAKQLIKIVNTNSSDSDSDFLEVPENVKGDSKSNSSDDDFVEVSETQVNATNKIETVALGSESEDDFLEVPQSGNDKILEVVIDKNNIDDDEDIFSDIFSGDKKDKTSIIDLSKILEQNSKDLLKKINLSDGNHTNLKTLSSSKKSDSIDLRKLMEENKSDKKSVGFLLKTNQEEKVDEVNQIKTDDSKLNTDVDKKLSIDREKKEIIEVREEETTSDSVTVGEKSEKAVKENEEEKIVEIKKVVPSLTTDELKQMEAYFEREKESLIVERSNKERLANNITDQMYQEAQELLRLFGVPYIVAPMEAEAQCAFLNEANLTDGTITDDSDIWLFGGKTVYKNFFNQSKRVMEFRSDNIEHHFNLTRLKLIQLSLLVGSDYTVGLQGIGPVTALEILAAFPSYNENAALSYQQVISGLIRFRNWFKQGRIAGPGRAALRTKLRNLEVMESFPNPNVAKAYLEPEIENNKDKFTWGKPDIIALTDYAKQKFGWSQLKSEEILKPVVQRLQETRMQSSIKDYFKTKHKIDAIDLSEKMSKRVKSAVHRMGKGGELDDSVEVEKKECKSRGRKKKIVEGKVEVSKKPRGGKTAVKDDGIEELELSECSKGTKTDDQSEEMKEGSVTKTEINASEKSKGISKRTIKTDYGKKSCKGRNKKTLDKVSESKGINKKSYETTKTLEKVDDELEIDEDLLELHKVEIASVNKVKEIEESVKEELERNLKRTLHAKEVIHQKERDKSEMVRSKMRAIEAFRKSKSGPGYVKKRPKLMRKPKDDAELSEDSSD